MPAELLAAMRADGHRASRRRDGNGDGSGSLSHGHGDAPLTRTSP